MAHDRLRSRTVRTAALLSVVVLGVLLAGGAGRWVTRADVGPAGPAATTRPAAARPAASVRATSTVPPAPAKRSPTTAPATTGAPLASIRLRPDGLGVAAFGAGERDALDRLERQLGAPDERGSWAGPTPFGTCPGPVRAVRWGRLYVLFTSGPTGIRPAAAGTCSPTGSTQPRGPSWTPATTAPPRPSRRRCGATAPGPQPASASAPPWPRCGRPTATGLTSHPASRARSTASGSASAPPGSCGGR